MRTTSITDSQMNDIVHVLCDAIDAATGEDAPPFTDDERCAVNERLEALLSTFGVSVRADD
jgi:hypothetical protein